MADAQTFTKPAEIAGIPEANTAVLPSGMPLNDLLMRAGQFHFAHAEAKKQAQEKAIQDHLKMFDLNTAGVWNEGIQGIEDYKQEGLKKFYNTEFLRRYDSGDLSALQEYSKFVDGFDSRITNEKLAAEYYKQKKEQLKDPNYQVLDANGNNANEQSLDKWLQQKSHNLSDAPDYQYQTPYNAMIPQQIAANIKPRSGTLEVVNPNGSTTTTTADYVPTEDVLNAVNQYFGANQQNSNGLTTGYVSLVNNPLLPNALDTQIGVYVNDKGEYAQTKKVKDPTTGVEVLQTEPFTTIPLHSATPLQMAQSQAMESLNQQYKQTQTAAPKGDGEGSQANVMPFYSSGAVTSVVPSTSGGMTETVTTNEYKKYDKDQVGADGKSYKKGEFVRDKDGKYVNATIEKQTPNEIGIYNGHLYSKPNEQPKNVPINPPRMVYDVSTNEWLTKDKIGAGVWTVSLIKDGTVYSKKNSGGKLTFLGSGASDLTNQAKGYDGVEMVQVTVQGTNEDKTYLIPKEGDIKEFISKLKLEGADNSTTTPTQSSGTQQQGGVKPKEDFRKKYNY